MDEANNPTPADAEKEKISKEMGWWSPGGGALKDFKGFDAYPERTDKVRALIDAARNQGIENGIKRATGSYSWSMPMKSVRTRNTAFKLYAVKFFNGKIKERREALLLQLKNELSHPAPVDKSDKE